METTIQRLTYHSISEGGVDPVLWISGLSHLLHNISSTTFQREQNLREKGEKGKENIAVALTVL